MSRLDTALQLHEKTLRTELANAQKRQIELENELLRQKTLIAQTKNDLEEVIAELDKRGTSQAIQTGTTIREEP
jgi:predicted  nucleic acid-binding Zn-ribbon protein